MKNDGGPAFPVTGFCIDASGAFCDKTIESQGMSLRDWFAGMALVGLITHGKDPIKGHCEAPQEQRLAAASYIIADAMLKERETTYEP